MLIVETRPYVRNRTLACFTFQSNEETKCNATVIYRHYRDFCNFLVML